MNDGSGNHPFSSKPYTPGGASASQKASGGASATVQDETDIDQEERDLSQRIVEAPAVLTIPSLNENGSSKTLSPTKR